jgi:hypothetical protein
LISQSSSALAHGIGEIGDKRTAVTADNCIRHAA